MAAEDIQAECEFLKKAGSRVAEVRRRYPGAYTLVDRWQVLRALRGAAFYVAWRPCWFIEQNPGGHVLLVRRRIRTVDGMLLALADGRKMSAEELALDADKQTWQEFQEEKARNPDYRGADQRQFLAMLETLY